MKKTLSLILMIFSWGAISAPDQIEVVFLSSKNVVQLKDLIEKQQQSILLANNEKVECIQMGEGCFHPQHGIIPKPLGKKKKKVEMKDVEVKTINSIETNMINCEEGEYFDIYCGNAKKLKEQYNIEVWVDVSASMKNVDYPTKEFYCERRHFVSRVKKMCKDKVLISQFNTSFSDSPTEDTFCINYGTNDKRQMVQWIKGSNAKHLLIITDVDEYQDEFREYLEQANARIHGIGQKYVTASQVFSMFKSKIKSLCK